ncbi:MAG: Gfo/Idh/MocA family oxidoreductase [Pseudomonadota bacterium]
MAQKTSIGIGLVGAGFMGRCHAQAFTAVDRLFEGLPHPTLAVLADTQSPEVHARRLGFDRGTEDWRALIDDPAVELVAIAAPNELHAPIALAALAAGKPVYCEKPLAASLTDAQTMTKAAQQSGLVNLVGFNYLHNPIIQHAQRLIAAGEIGEVRTFRAIHGEDYMRDSNQTSWRLNPQGGGVSLDLGSHVISLARALIGPIQEIMGATQTVLPGRQVDEQAQYLIRFANGAGGSLQANWLAVGRTMQLSFEIVGATGAISFTQERMNELQFYKDGMDGFCKIEAGPAHPPYGRFTPAPGHQLGFNDLKIIEVNELLSAIAQQRMAFPDFAEALAVQKTIHAGLESARTRQWVCVA